MAFLLLVGGGNTNLDVQTTVVEKCSITENSVEEISNSVSDSCSTNIVESLSREVAASQLSEKTRSRGKLVRQTAVNPPIMEDNNDWAELEDALSSTIAATIRRVSIRILPEKPRRRLSASYTLERANSTNLPGALFCS